MRERFFCKVRHKNKFAVVSIKVEQLQGAPYQYTPSNHCQHQLPKQRKASFFQTFFDIHFSVFRILSVQPQLIHISS